MKTIILSSGHYYKDDQHQDPGASYNGLIENKLTIILTKKTADILRKHSIGVLTVPDDVDLIPTIEWINARASEQPIELCVEIHINTIDKPNIAQGVEGWYYHNNAQSLQLTQFLIDAVNVESGLLKRTPKDEFNSRFGRLGFVHDTTPLASLIETGFINSDIDRKILSTDEGLFNIAKGIARGILGYLGEAWKPELLETVPAPNYEVFIADLKRQLKEKDDTIQLCQRQWIEKKQKIIDILDL